MIDFVINYAKEIFVYVLAINLIAFGAMGLDKFKAQKGMWRTKEKTLFILAAIGGSIGAIAGMYTFRHKTKHTQFVYGMPMILVAQIVGIVCLLVK